VHNDRLVLRISAARAGRPRNPMEHICNCRPVSQILISAYRALKHYQRWLIHCG